jgi:hypothetical protein
LAAASASAPGEPAPEKPVTGFKTQAATQAKSSATAEAATSLGSTASSPAASATGAAPAQATETGAAPQLVASVKPDNDNTGNGAKPDAAVNPASAAVTHDPAAANAPSIAPDASAQANLLAAPAQISTPISTASLTAAPATGAPVPVSGR